MYLEYIVKKEEENTRLNIFLREKGISLAHIKRMKFIEDGILVENKKQNTDYILSENQTVKILLNIKEEKETTVISEDIKLEILYEDEHLIVINKPYGMPIHPSLNHPKGTLANAFVGYFEKKGEKRIARIINRLDKNTSGLVLIAKDAYSAQWFKHRVEKSYYAIVKGEIGNNMGVIEEPIARMGDSIITRCVDKNGQWAKTEYQVIEKNKEYSYLKIKLHTGRTHQIRVHFSYINHPLIGDDMYGEKSNIINRHALHCKELIFTKVNSEEIIKVVSELPNDMKNLLNAFK